MKEKILELRKQGLTYDEIKKELGCSKGTIAYHCGEGQKEKTGKRQIKNRAKKHPFKKKWEAFLCNKTKLKQNYKIQTVLENILYLKIYNFNGKNMNTDITVKQIIDKFGENPKCYLTGKEIDIYQTRTYHFDHIKPKSRGGLNTIDNLGICTKGANQAKHDLEVDEFIQLCKDVLLNSGYTINRI